MESFLDKLCKRFENDRISEFRLLLETPQTRKRPSNFYIAKRFLNLGISFLEFFDRIKCCTELNVKKNSHCILPRDVGYLQNPGKVRLKILSTLRVPTFYPCDTWAPTDGKKLQILNRAFERPIPSN